MTKMLTIPFLLLLLLLLLYLLLLCYRIWNVQRKKNQTEKKRLIEAWCWIVVINEDLWRASSSSSERLHNLNNGPFNSSSSSIIIMNENGDGYYMMMMMWSHTGNADSYFYDPMVENHLLVMIWYCPFQKKNSTLWFLVQLVYWCLSAVCYSIDLGFYSFF